MRVHGGTPKELTSKSPVRDNPLKGGSRCVASGKESGGEVRPVSATTLGASVPMKRETLMAVCQLAGISAAALILPCSLIDLKFDTDFLGMLMQAMLAGVALSLMVAVWTDQEE